MGAVDPSFGSIVEELDRDEEPMAWIPDQSNELYAPPIAPNPLPNEVGRLNHWAHERHDEGERWPSRQCTASPYTRRA